MTVAKEIWTKQLKIKMAIYKKLLAKNGSKTVEKNMAP